MSVPSFRCCQLVAVKWVPTQLVQRHVGANVFGAINFGADFIGADVFGAKNHIAR